MGLGLYNGEKPDRLYGWDGQGFNEKGRISNDARILLCIIAEIVVPFPREIFQEWI